MRKNYQMLFVTTVMAVLTACSVSNRLDNEKAVQLISDYLANDEYFETYFFDKIQLKCIPRAMGTYSWRISTEKKMADAGLIEVDQTTRNCSPTGKSRPFLQRKDDDYFYIRNLEKREVQSITGIKLSDSGTSAIVKFNFMNIPNEYGQTRLDNGIKKLRQQSLKYDLNIPIEGTAALALWDDGWRVERITYEKLKN